MARVIFVPGGDGVLLRDTIHFNIRGPFPPTLAPVPGTPSAAAMAFWGTLNIATTRTIAFMHLHQMDDGAGNAVVEVYRLRAGVFTLLGNITLVQGTGDFAFATVVSADPLLLAGDYLYAQAITAPVGGAGFTIDVHFAVP
jgi:hypothetical protein